MMKYVYVGCNESFEMKMKYIIRIITREKYLKNLNKLSTHRISQTIRIK